MSRVQKILHLFILPIISGILLALAALPSRVWFIGFVALFPLFLAIDYTVKTRKPFRIFLLQLFILFLIFFTWVGFWILKTANMGFVLGFLLIIPFVILLSPYILLRKKGSKLAPAYFIAAWLTAEMLQTWFQLGSPFYNLGHNLGAVPKLIQWYSITGAAGGTLWILVVNFILFSLGKSILNKQKDQVWKSVLAGGVLIIPVILSLIMYFGYQERNRAAEVLVVHPSTDNTDVKYRVNIYELLDIYLDIILPQLTETTEYVVLPETALTNAGWVTDFNRNLVFQHWFEKTKDYPNLKLVTGAITYEAISDVEKIRGYQNIPGIRFSENYNTYYYTYNSILYLERNQHVQMRVKEKLVPYQEFAPYPLIMPRIAPVGIDFQFSTHQTNLQQFNGKNSRKTAALICYELVFGKLFAKAALDGAEAFFVVLNEGWYDDPKVPRQFLQLSVIRAIENRRYIAHSSNLGISAIINQKGEIVASENSKKSSFLKHKMVLNRKTTLATTLGNYIEWAALATITFLLIQLAFRKIYN